MTVPQPGMGTQSTPARATRATRAVVLRPQVWVVGTACMLAGHLVGLALRGADGEHGSTQLRWFDLGLENNIPTLWTVLLLLRVAVVAVWANAGDRPAAWGWRAAAAVAALLAADEWVGWHEHLNSVGAWARERGVALPTYAWVLPGAALAILGAVLAVSWGRRLPRRGQRLLLLALMVYGAGALGFEALSGYAVGHGAGWRAWSALTAVEETLEMLGAIIAAAALSAGLPRVVNGASRAIPRAQRPRPPRALPTSPPT